MLKNVLDKVLSGRFIFTVITASVFAILSIQGKLPVDKVTEVTLIVLYAYFTRGDRNGGKPA